MVRNSDIEKSFQEGESIVDWLPYWSYEDGIFIQVDGSLGVVWELKPIPIDLESPENLERIATSIESLVVRLPEGLTCQLILLCDNRIKDSLNLYQNIGKGDFGYCKISTEGKLSHLEEGKRGLFHYKNTNYCPKRIRTFLTVRYFPAWAKPTFIDKAASYFTKSSPIRKKFEENYGQAIADVERYSNIAEETLKGAGIEFSRVDAGDLLGFLYPLLNPRRTLSSSAPTFRQDLPFREQILFNSPKATGEGFIFEGMKTRIISLKEIPLQTSPGMFTAEAGDRPPLLDLVENFIMVMNIYIPEQNKELTAVKQKKTFAFLHRANIFGDREVESTIIKDETDEVIKKIFEAGHRIIQCRTHFITWGEDDTALQQAVDNINNSLHFLRCEGILEEIIGASLYLQCLPLGYDPSTERFVHRARRFVSDNIADMLPLYGTYRGTRTPAQLYLNRRGETVSFDFFDSDTAPHGIIAGVTGAGKSYFTNDLIMQNMRLGAQFFILDKGGSYKKIARLNKGQYVNIEPNNPICINPFLEAELTNERQSFLILLLSEMASGGEERERLTREEKAFIQKGIVAAYESHTGNKEITLSEVAERIGEKGEKAKSVATRLTNFLSGGPYGGFFDGQNQFNLKSEFTVFELGALSSYKDLQVVMLMNIMYQLTNRVSSPKLKAKRKYLLIDEAWSLLNTQNTAEFLEGAFRTFRKYGTSAIAITQQTQDFTRTTAGEAIRANAPNRIFLKQSPEVVTKMKKDLDLTDRDIKVLKTLDTIKGKFSEVLIKTDKGGGVIRLVADPINYWLFTTDPRDEKYLNKKIEECNGNIEKAINLARKENPYGIQ